VVRDLISINKDLDDIGHAVHAQPQRAKTVCPCPQEATHPRCSCEGYPDRPGRASGKEGES
jgi:hypothetical protein